MELIPEVATAQFVDVAPFALGGPASAAIPDHGSWPIDPCQRRRSEIFEILGRFGRAAAAGCEPCDPVDLVEAVQTCPHLITDLDLLRSLCRVAVDAHVTASAQGCGLAAGLCKPNGPDPTVDTNAHARKDSASGGARRQNGVMAADYVTIAGAVDTEIELSRSRFITRLERVSDEAKAREVIAQVRSLHPRARHHCTAFVIGSDGRIQRSNDDGEPGGTAGAPMLDALTSAGLSDVVAVVTRYFGGVLLGAGGLTRAYRAAVAGAVAEARTVRRVLRSEVVAELAYDVAANLESECRRRGYGIGDASYSDVVVQRVYVPESEVAAMYALAAEVSAGSARLSTGDARYVDVSE